MNKRTFLLLACALSLTCACDDTSGVRFASLETEMRENPEGIPTLKPRFSWQFTSDGYDVMQTAWHVRAAQQNS